MSSNIIKKTILIDNMTCANCENVIEQGLLNEPGIIGVTASYSSGKAVVIYDEKIISFEKIKGIIEKAGYHVKSENTHGETGAGAGNNAGDNNSEYAAKAGRDYTDLIGIAIILLAVYMIARRFGLFNIFYQFPAAKEGMGYGMLFFIGALTSVHCVAMCGGICLSQCVTPGSQKGSSAGRFGMLRPSILYNLGRVASYTMIGALVGTIGSAVSFSNAMKGTVQILAGVFMVIMGLNMLNLFPWLRRLNPRMPKIFARKIYSGRNSRSPLYIGLLNGLMPCGPLQAMQLYALSTGSPIKGALSMFLFSVGTLPLMFVFGAVSSYLSKKFTRKLMTASAFLVVILGVFMLQNGAGLSGIALPSFTSAASAAQSANVAKIKSGVQTVTTKLQSGRYEPIVVQKGIPVKWTIQADASDINGCNGSMILQKYGIQKDLKAGDNTIEFTPNESGTFPYSCWMGMIRSKITVVDDINNIDSSALKDNSSGYGSGGSCCISGNAGTGGNTGNAGSGGSCCGGAASNSNSLN